MRHIEGLTQFAFGLLSRGCKSLILDGEMSEWLSAYAAMPLGRDISPQLARASHASGGG